MRSTNVSLGIAGHAGIGHTHCPGGLIQDDTAGFTVAGTMMRDTLSADTRVSAIEVDVSAGTIRVVTRGGGVGEATPRRGITPAEARLMREVEGHDALFCQTTAIETLGRMYGQGVLETPSCLAAALANAALDTFKTISPHQFQAGVESVRGNHGLIGGMTTTIEGVPASLLATVNASTSGLGPNEDLEGNVALGSKRRIMEALGILRCPTIVLEGKAYSPSLSDRLKQNTFLVRANRNLDNIIVAEALFEAATALGYPVMFLDDVFPHCEGVLKRKSIEVADTVIRTAQDLRAAETGAEKVRIVAELARLVSEECGGMSFMTNQVHDVVRQVGMVPGTAAVLSMLVTKEYLAHWKIPRLEPEDVRMMERIVRGAVLRLASRLDAANEIVARLYQDVSPLEALLD